MPQHFLTLPLIDYPGIVPVARDIDLLVPERRISVQQALPSNAVPAGVGDRIQARIEALQRSDATADHDFAGFTVDVFRQVATHRARRRQRATGLDERGGIITVIAVVGVDMSRGEILDHDRGVIVIGDHGSENLRHHIDIAPQRRGVIERIGGGGDIRQQAGQFRGYRGRGLREIEPDILAVIGNHRGIAAGTGKSSQAVSLRHSGDRQELQRLDHFDRGFHAYHGELFEQRLESLVGSGQRTGMAERNLRAEPRLTGLEHDNGFTQPKRLDRSIGKFIDVLDALDIKPYRPDRGLVEQHIEIIFDRQHRLVSGRHHVRNRHRAIVHDHVGRQHAALHDQRDAFMASMIAGTEGP